MLNKLLFFALLLLVVLSPLPLGSNRDWSWSLCALSVALLALAWVSANLAPKGKVSLLPNYMLPGLFLLVIAWALIQLSSVSPLAWHHPLWEMSNQALLSDASGAISLSAENTWTALMRLASYGLVFFLAFELGKDRTRAQTTFAWITIAGLAYGIFGLFVYWSAYNPEWLFGERMLPHDVRSTFINRNHFATWQGLAMLCSIAWFYHRMARPVVMPYSVPENREQQVERFILKAWKPLTALLLMATALVLTHSRGGFAAALGATAALLVLLDRRARVRRGLSRVTVVAALFVASLAFYLNSEVLLDRINRTDITTEERMAVFVDVNRGIAANPVLGFGYGTFADSFRLYDRNDSPVHYDRAHNTWLENAFELGLPAAAALFMSLLGLAVICLNGVQRRHRDWVFPATGFAASVLVGLHAVVDFSLQIPAVAILYACIMGIACAQSYSSRESST